MIKLSNCTESSIENWCKEFDNTKRSNLSEDEARVFISLSLSESEWDKSGIPSDLANHMNENFIYNVIKVRVQLYEFELTNTVAVFLAFMLRTPGEVVMILTYLQYKCHKYNIWEVDMSFIGLRGFPCGFPTEGEFQRMWDLQKCDGYPDNLLDYPKYMDSIRKTNSN